VEEHTKSIMLILGYLVRLSAEVFHVKPLMALPAKNLEVIKIMVTLLKILVMGVMGSAAAYLATIPSAFPCNLLYLPSPTGRIRNLSPAIFPHRILFSRESTV
jgi:hypothetical protein